MKTTSACRGLPYFQAGLLACALAVEWVPLHAYAQSLSLNFASPAVQSSQSRTFIGPLVFGGAVAGLAGGLGLQIWTMAIDYPVAVSGKPYLSIPAFIPVAFETTILLAALTESLARSVRRPQDGPDDEDDAPVVPVCTCPPCLAERERGERP